MDTAAATICPNPTEGVFKYTVVTSGRPVVDGLHHGDLPVPADFLRKGAEARLGKRQLAKLTSCGMLPLIKGREPLKLHNFKKPTVQPLDPTEMADYSPRTTTFVNGRPSLVSTPRAHHPLSPTSARAMPGPSHASPESVRDASGTTRDDLEDVASVDSAPGTMRFLQLRPRTADACSSVPEALSNPRLAANRFPQDVSSTTDESLDLYLEQFFPELHSMSDAELLRLMEPTPAPAPAAPALPTRSSTLAILQDMLLTQGSYAAATGAAPGSAGLKQQHTPHAASTASNPPSNNWSSIASDEQISHNWSDAPSQNWRSPSPPAPGPANWMSWPSTAAAQSRKRQRDPAAEDLDWPTLAEHLPALSGGDVAAPAAKRQMLHHPLQQAPLPQQQATAEHDPLLYAAGPHHHHGHELPAAQRPNPFASVSKLALMPNGAPAHLPHHHRGQAHPLELQSYLSMQSSVAPQLGHHAHHPHHAHLGCSPTSGDSSSRASALDTIEPASVLEAALRDLRAKPDAQAC